MITVSIATRPSFHGSTSNLRYDCKHLAVKALTALKPDQGHDVASSILPARPHDMGAIDAIIMIAASDMWANDADRTELGGMLTRAILEVHPELRISVLLSFDLEVDETYGVVHWLSGMRIENFTEALSKEVTRLKKLRGLPAA